MVVWKREMVKQEDLSEKKIFITEDAQSYPIGILAFQ